MLKPVHITIELIDGAIHGPLRSLAADKIAAEAACRRNGWPLEDGPRLHTLLAFFAAKRAGLTTSEGYESWMETLADYTISNNEDAAGPTETGSAS